jgi:hypothetical protein
MPVPRVVAATTTTKAITTTNNPYSTIVGASSSLPKRFRLLINLDMVNFLFGELLKNGLGVKTLLATVTDSKPG